MKKKKKKAPFYKPKKNIISHEYQIFHQNMVILERRYPEIYKLLEGLAVTNDYNLVPTERHWPNLQIASRSLLYYDAHDPVEDVKQQLISLELKNTRMAVFLGIGLGYELVYYLSEMSMQQETTHVLVVENDPYIFLAALRVMDLREVLGSPHLHLMVGVPESELYLEFQRYLADGGRFVFLKALAPIYHPSALVLNKDYYLAALRQLREAAQQQLIDFGNCPHDSIIGVENMLLNLPEIINNPGINQLYGAFQGKPAIVICSGPSLNKNKHLLKGLEDKAVLICANSTMRSLLEMGIRPHMVVALERLEDSVKLMEGFTEEMVSDIYYAACPVVHPRNYAEYAGPRIIVYRAFDHFKWLGIEKGMLHIKASSGNMAFKLAAAMGCEPIILTGQDLAFGEDDTTHAGGMDYGDKQGEFYERPRIQVPGNLGKPVWTDSGFWYTCLKGYEVDIAEYGGLVINSTEGGAYIKGTEVMPLQVAIEKYLQEPLAVLDVMKEKLAMFTVSNSLEEAKLVYKNIATSIEDIDTIYANCLEGIRLYEENKQHLSRCLDEPEYFAEAKKDLPALKLKMLAPRDESRKLSFTWQLLLTHIVQSYSIKFDMEIVAVPNKYDDAQMSDVEIMLRHAEWYAVVGDIVIIVKGLLLKAKKEISEKYNIIEAG